MEDEYKAYWPCPPWCVRDHDRSKWAHSGEKKRWDDEHGMFIEVEPVWLPSEQHIDMLAVSDYHHARLYLSLASAEQVHRILGEAIATLTSVTRASVGHPEPGN